MATYAALVSLMNVLNRIQSPTCPVSFDQSQIRSLLDKVSSLVEFIETSYSHLVSKNLEIRIVNVAFAAEDTVESYLVDQILVGNGDEEYALFSQDLEKLMQEFDFLVHEAMEVKEKNSDKEKSLVYFGRVDSFAPPRRMNKIVGLDDELIRLMDLLTSDQSSRQVIPVAGMGGIGKTTLATHIYNHPYVVNHFHVRAWVRISQDSVGSIIRTLLRGIGFPGTSQIGDEELGEQLHKCLCGRKYLIVMDDIWSSEVWDEVRRFFPDFNNGSRILLTTRLLNVALDVGSCSPYEMKFLDSDKSWRLLSQTIFDQEVCPSELEKIGMKIARSCKGLPLVIVVIGGLLKMLEKTIDHWAKIAKNVISAINTKDDGHCLEILSVSYNHLPVHLKPCFLHMATFTKDDNINTSELINLWVVDGFLKPAKDRTLEEVASELLNDLLERNLIMASPLGLNNLSIQNCSVHDSLKEVCLRETQNERFLYSISDDKADLSKTLENERRLVYHPSGNESNLMFLFITLFDKLVSLRGFRKDPLPPIPRARSFYCNKWGLLMPHTRCGLLRVLHVLGGRVLHISTAPLVNLRYLACKVDRDGGAKLLSSISLFWNLEVLIVHGADEKLILPSEIWELTNLRYVEFQKITLPDPRAAKTSHILANLRTLKGIKNFNCSNEVFNRIPYLRELSICYGMDYVTEYHELLSSSFTNLARHPMIQTLTCEFLPNEEKSLCVIELEKFKFSHNLLELELRESNIPWENMAIVGSLPRLEVLNLVSDAFCGDEWNSTEGEFQRLKCLKICGCDLRIWRAESSHFPRLEQLILEFLDLEEISLEMGDVTCLQLISLLTDKKSLILSAREILDQREDQGSHDLVVEGLYFMGTNKANRKLEEKAELEEMQMANNNFRVQLYVQNLPENEEDWTKFGPNFVKMLVANMWDANNADLKIMRKQLFKAWRIESADSEVIFRVFKAQMAVAYGVGRILRVVLLIAGLSVAVVLFLLLLYFLYRLYCG